VVSGGNFEWEGNPRFPELNEPFAGYHGLILTKQFGRHAFLAKMRMETQREMGATLSAQSAFQILQGIETLPLRVDRHTTSSLALARWLEAHPKVLWVSHPLLESHPSHTFAKKMLKRGSGGMLAFAMKPVGEKPSDIVAQELIDATVLCLHCPNIVTLLPRLCGPWEL
jgi:O-acetylhomoserine/O-acetylserine sulfhydrylase-like pyridoxal-dependent enzyme